MAGSAPKQEIPFETLKQARNLWARFSESPLLKRYLESRRQPLIAAALLCLLISVSCTAAMVVFLAGTKPLLVLMALILAPFVLLGSLFVQAYVFFAWLESRALSHASTHPYKAAPGTPAYWLRKKLKIDLGQAPPVPWALAGIFVFAPLAVLAFVAPKLAAALIVLAIAGVLLYSRLDR
jgi:hypothetical protein